MCAHVTYASAHLCLPMHADAHTLCLCMYMQAKSTHTRAARTNCRASRSAGFCTVSGHKWVIAAGVAGVLAASSEGPCVFDKAEVTGCSHTRAGRLIKAPVTEVWENTLSYWQPVGAVTVSAAARDHPLPHLRDEKPVFSFRMPPIPTPVPKKGKRNQVYFAVFFFFLPSPN